MILPPLLSPVIRLKSRAVFSSRGVIRAFIMVYDEKSSFSGFSPRKTLAPLAISSAHI